MCNPSESTRQLRRQTTFCVPAAAAPWFGLVGRTKTPMASLLMSSCTSYINVSLFFFNSMLVISAMNKC